MNAAACCSLGLVAALLPPAIPAQAQVRALTLEQAVQAALARHPALAREEAREQVARYGYLPRVEVVAALWARGSGHEAPGGPTPSADGLVFSSEARGDSEIQDLALYRVRPLLSTIAGVSAPPPSGGKIKTIVVYADAERMRAYRISPEDIATQLGRQNLTLPAGNVRVNGFTTIAATNAMVAKPSDLADLPLRTGSGPTVFLRDVVNGVKAALPQMRALVPPDIKLDLELDQTIYVLAAIRGLAIEGILGALLTGLMVLFFLRDWRSALIVVLTIPFSILAAVVGLRLVGQTINLMTLGGLALAVGVLVDEATVAIENIHAHLGRAATSSGRAVLDAMREVMAPRLLAMLCVPAVFLPAFFMVGIGRALFPPLALAVAFSMVASFLLSSTLVPVLAAWLFRRAPPAHSAGGFFARLQDRFASLVGSLVRRRLLVFGGYLLACSAALLLSLGLATELFPLVDTGQFQLRIRAPDGTQLERTEQLVREVDRLIRETVGEKSVAITLANVGNPPWSYPVNGIFTWNSGPHEALLLVALNRGDRPPVHELQETLRETLRARFPGVRFSFEAGDIVSQVLDFGAPTPINVTISGNDLAQTRPFAERLAGELRKLPELRDVQIPQSLDYPTLEVKIDRERAAQLGVDAAQVGRSLVDATSSSVLIQPNFWVNPGTGIPYRVALRVPESEIASAEDLKNLPVMSDGSPRPILGDLASVTPGRTFGEIDHVNSQRTISVLANVGGRDLGAAAKAVQRAVAAAGEPPRGARVAVHGQVEQMLTTLATLREGLLLAIVVVLLLLIANFQSVGDALIVLSTVPAVLAGTVVLLFVTGSTLNVQSMMGAIMSIGVSVANALLLVTFAREHRQVGASPAQAAIAAARSRLRPILMTSLAMIAGMVPMALGVGEGGEQSAPLGRAVIGGLAASLVATLLVLPAVYALFAARHARPVSLAPDEDQTADSQEAVA